MVEISRDDARRLTLNSQGLGKNNFGRGTDGTLAAIEQLGYVQIDTISVVERAHHHILWSRIPTYSPRHLDALLRDRRVFEYWSHAAAYLPMRDFRYSLIRKNKFKSGERERYKDVKVLRYVLDRIKAEGALRSVDFEHDRVAQAWWNWKPAKMALEQLFQEGILMVSARENFQKVYNLTERVLPSHVDVTTPSLKEYSRFLIEQSIRSHGFTNAFEAAYLLGGDVKRLVQGTIKEMANDGVIEEMRIEGTSEVWYSDGARLLSLNRKSRQHPTIILSPFDNAVIQRRRLKSLFDFDYTIECYLPEAKRIHGYFSLPVLLNREFVGRCDCKADRQNKTLIIQSFHAERAMDEEAFILLASSFRQYASFNDCDTIVIAKTRPTRLKSALNSALREVN